MTQENMVRRLLARMTGREQTARLDALERTIRKLADAQREHAAVQQAALAALTARQQQQSTTREVKEAVDAVRALGHVVERTIEELLGRGGPIERQRLDEKRVRRRLEQIEKLEQLRVLENGYEIACDLTDDATIGVDTPEDAAKFEMMVG